MALFLMELPHWQCLKCWQVMKHVISARSQSAPKSALEWSDGYKVGKVKKNGEREEERSQNQRRYCNYFHVRSISAACCRNLTLDLYHTTDL